MALYKMKIGGSFDKVTVEIERAGQLMQELNSHYLKLYGQVDGLVDALDAYDLEGLAAGCAEGDHANCRQEDADCICPCHNYEEP